MSRAPPDVVGYQPIENYGVIGDLETVALVGMDGAIDFLCAPRFDSPTIFAALLDDQKGGRFSIEPQLSSVRQKQVYLADTNVLITRFLADEGVAEISDFMAIDVEACAHTIVRRVKTVTGTIRYRMRCAPRFDYARAEHQVEARPREVLFISKGKDGLAFRLNASVEIRSSGPDAVAEFTLPADESAWFIFEEAHPGQAPHASAEHYVSEAFKATVNFWRAWVNRSTYRGRWREMVTRSALALKLITSRRYGSLVAAPTFGLPERFGGVRNWDYRYTWIRDSAFTLYALIRLGFTDEAKAFMRWIEARLYELAPDGALQIMYGIDGRHVLDEEILTHLHGYRGASPVRIGNDAYKQLQLDIYGELMDAVYLSNKFSEPISHDLWLQLIRLIDWLCANWHQPDQGIWEVRGGRREFLHSRFMCWVAVDRAIRLAFKRSFPAPLERWHRVRDEIYAEIFRELWSPNLRAFVQYKGADTVDAAALLMPLIRFMAPTDPRWLSTLSAIEKALVTDSLVRRYEERPSLDGFPVGEGTFNMCTFWYVECLSRAGDLEQARLVFDKMLSYANHLGLYSEELSARADYLGNFPQAFTHLALISTAYNLDLQLSKERHL
jgi:GH15 family glucan-1,4-alpha-glucosidase